MLKTTSNPLRGAAPTHEMNLESTVAAERPPRAGADQVSVSPSAEYFLRKGKAPEPILESVIGEDERVRILDTHLMPWCMICNLRIEGPLGAAVGTGWLVGPRTVLTAGHCVYHETIGGWAERIVVTPGMNRDRADHGSVVARRFSALDAWTKADSGITREQRADADVGAIHLEEGDRLGDRLGWFGIAVRPDDQLMQTYVHVAGYPGEPARGFGREMWAHRNKIIATTPLRLYYDVDTSAGQSGGPAFVVEGDNAAPIAVAVHAYGTGGTPDRLGVIANSAPRITKPLFDTIQHWIDSGPDDGQGS